jgi:hypothetical protein
VSEGLMKAQMMSWLAVLFSVLVVAFFLKSFLFY